MKLKELLKGRDKLRKYDELKDWRKYFETNRILLNTGGRKYHHPAKKETISEYIAVLDELPDHIKQIILNAIDAEMKKMEEE